MPSSFPIKARSWFIQTAVRFQFFNFHIEVFLADYFLCALVPVVYSYFLCALVPVVYSYFLCALGPAVYLYFL
jgi:hypothetical protein